MSHTQRLPRGIHPNLSLEGRPVFLSASFPSRERAPRFYKTADPDEITDAVVSIVRAVFAAKGRIVFGGHPTISPLVLMVAEEYLPRAVAERKALAERHLLPVKVYQSEVFRQLIPDATKKLFEWGLGEIVWAPVACGERVAVAPIQHGAARQSLQVMRQRMLSDNPLVGAVFIGGMEGVREEAEIFQEHFGRRPVYCVGAPGGAARELAAERHAAYEPESRLTQAEIRESRRYPALMQRIVLDISLRLRREG